MWRIREGGLVYIGSISGRGPRRSVLGKAVAVLVTFFSSFTKRKG
jgi:hypothetical protein